MAEHPFEDSTAQEWERAEKKTDREVKEAEKERKKAVILLDQKTLKTVQTLLRHQDSKINKISLEAAKHLSKLQGLEIERHQVSGGSGRPVLVEITAGHAMKIREAATK